MLIEEKYETWSIEKFRRLIERFMEDEHMATTKDAYRANHEMLVPAAEAFKKLHPRAYANWQRRMREEQGFTYDHSF